MNAWCVLLVYVMILYVVYVCYAFSRSHRIVSLLSFSLVKPLQKLTRFTEFAAGLIV